MTTNKNLKTKPPKKKQHRKIVNHGITTDKFNQNAKNEKIELCGVARAFLQISENGP